MIVIQKSLSRYYRAPKVLALWDLAAVITGDQGVIRGYQNVIERYRDHR